MAGNFGFPLKRLGKNGNFGFWVDDGPPPQPPTITLQPTDKTVVEGENATFLSDGENYDSIQWKKSKAGTGPWEDVPGETNKNFTIIKAELDFNGDKYRVEYTNAVDTVRSNEVVLTVNEKPDFVVSVVDMSDSTKSIYGADTVKGLGAITPDDWSPDGKIEYVKSLRGGVIGVFYIKKVSGGKWLDYNTLNVTARTATDSATVKVPYIAAANMYYNNNKDQVNPIFEFLQRNVGNDVSFFINGSGVIMTGVTP